MKSVVLASVFLTLLLPARLPAATFHLPSDHFDVIGQIETVIARYEDTLMDIALRKSIGQDQMERANPGVDRWIPGEGTPVLVPSHFILPNAPRTGLVLNLPEMRMYYFPPRQPGEPLQVQTYPIGIGRMEWSTPLGVHRITEKTVDPSWRPPESIRRERAKKGEILPAVVPPGPDNPLGRHAMRLSLPSYLIHGTNKPLGVGMRVSHGCIRMLPGDIERLFPQIPIGTQVNIINQPVKVGWFGGQLYIEVHPPLEEFPGDRGTMVQHVMAALNEAMSRRQITAALDNEVIDRELEVRSGLPIRISFEG